MTGAPTCRDPARGPQSSPALGKALAQPRDAQLDDLDGAEEALRRAVSGSTQRNGAAWTSLGVVRRLLGERDEIHSFVTRMRVRAGFTGPRDRRCRSQRTSRSSEGRDPSAGAGRAAIDRLRRRRMRPAIRPAPARVLWERGLPCARMKIRGAASRRGRRPSRPTTPLRLEYIRLLIEARLVGRRRSIDIPGFCVPR